MKESKKTSSKPKKALLQTQSLLITAGLTSVFILSVTVADLLSGTLFYSPSADQVKTPQIFYQNQPLAVAFEPSAGIFLVNQPESINLLLTTPHKISGLELQILATGNRDNEIMRVTIDRVVAVGQPTTQFDEVIRQTVGSVFSDSSFRQLIRKAGLFVSFLIPPGFAQGPTPTEELSVEPTEEPPVPSIRLMWVTSQKDDTKLPSQVRVEMTIEGLAPGNGALMVTPSWWHHHPNVSEVVGPNSSPASGQDYAYEVGTLGQAGFTFVESL